MIFGISPIFALLPLVVYIVLAFKDVNAILNVLLCVILSAIMTKHPLLGLGSVIAESLGSFLAMIGFIIMMGAALGNVLKKTGVAENIVMALMRKIGINTPKKAILATMVCSVILVSVLGTLAGANAILAPIVIPLVASIGITPSTLAAVFQGAGATGLFIGPFSPQVITLLGLMGLNYGQYLLGAGLPVAIVCWIVTFVMALRIQKKTAGVYAYEIIEKANLDYKPTKKTIQATIAFFVVLAAMVAYGMLESRGSSYSIVVMFTTAIVTGLVGGLKLNDLFDALVEGASRYVWLFIMFVLFTPFLKFIDDAGAFKALVGLLQPLMRSQSKPLFVLVASLTGIFGVGGAAVAQSVVIDKMFKELVTSLGVSPLLWAATVLIGSQITSFAYPEADMLGQMGLARSKDIKNMVKFGITVTAATVVLNVVLALFL